MATLTYNWLRQLVWPATDTGPLNCTTGITWVERLICRECVITNSMCRACVHCEAPKIVKLVKITPITMVYGTYNYTYWGESKPTYNWGASHCKDHLGIMRLCFVSGYQAARERGMSFTEFGTIIQGGAP